MQTFPIYSLSRINHYFCKIKIRFEQYTAYSCWACPLFVVSSSSGITFIVNSNKTRLNTSVGTAATLTQDPRTCLALFIKRKSIQNDWGVWPYLKKFWYKKKSPLLPPQPQIPEPKQVSNCLILVDLCVHVLRFQVHQVHYWISWIHTGCKFHTCKFPVCGQKDKPLSRVLPLVWWVHYINPYMYLFKTTLFKLPKSVFWFSARLTIVSIVSSLVPPLFPVEMWRDLTNSFNSGEAVSFSVSWRFVSSRSSSRKPVQKKVWQFMVCYSVWD